MPVATETVNSVTAYLSKVFDAHTWWAPLSSQFDEVELWFRGAGNCQHELVPGAVWLKNYDEVSAVAEFETRVSGLLRGEPADAWEWYFLMQHNGLSTRLLDWTESPLVALHFALTADPVTEPCVWIIDPRSLNRATTGLEEMICPGGDFSAKWLTESVKQGLQTFDYKGKQFTNDHPIAILPPRREPRIAAQRGTFTVHGVSRQSISDVLLSNPAQFQRVFMLKIESGAVDQMRRDCCILGSRTPTLFPEPPYIAKDLMRKWTSP